MSDRDYCYPPDFTVLRNKLDIRDTRSSRRGIFKARARRALRTGWDRFWATSTMSMRFAKATGGRNSNI